MWSAPPFPGLRRFAYRLYFAQCTAAGLAQSVERLTAEEEVAGFYSWDKDFNYSEMKIRTSHCKWLDLREAFPSPVADVKIVSSISTFVLNTLTFK